MRTWVLLVVCAGGCIGTRYGGGVILPARYDVGAYSGDRGGQGLHGAAGLHWASVSPDPKTPVDVGLGWIVDMESTAEPAGTIARGAGDTMAPSQERLEVMTHGPYLEVAQRVSGGRHQRTFVGGRAEWLFRGGESGVGLTARVSRELFATLSSKGRSAAMGALAIGVFVEVSYREIESYREDLVVAGLSFRLPAVAVK